MLNFIKNSINKRNIIIFIVFFAVAYIIGIILDNDIKFTNKKLGENYIDEYFMTRSTKKLKPAIIDYFTNYNLLHLKKNKNGNIHEIDMKKINLKDGLKIVDCGGGNGDLYGYISKKYKLDYTIIENNKANIIKIKTKYPNVKVVNDTFDNIHQYFKPNTLDRILFLESHGYSKNHTDLFKKCYNLLKKRGLLYIKSVGFINSQIGFIRNSQKRYINNTQYNMEHHQHTMKRLKKNGYKDIKYTSINYPLLMLTYSPMNFIYIIGNLFRHNNLLYTPLLLYMNSNTIIAKK